MDFTEGKIKLEEVMKRIEDFEKKIEDIDYNLFLIIMYLSKSNFKSNHISNNPCNISLSNKFHRKYPIPHAMTIGNENHLKNNRSRFHFPN